MRNIIYLLPFIFFLGCNNPQAYDPCLQALEVVSEIEFSNGEIEYEVIGEISDFSKGASDLEAALEETMNVDKKDLNGCLVFEENFPDFFGFFILNARTSLGISKIELHKKAKVKLRRFKLKNPIEETFRKQKNVEYLYLVMEVQSLE